MLEKPHGLKIGFKTHGVQNWLKKPMAIAMVKIVLKTAARWLSFFETVSEEFISKSWKPSKVHENYFGLALGINSS